MRFARNAAVLEADPALGLGGPTIAWCDAAFRAMLTMEEPSFPVASASHPYRHRLPDAIVSNNAIENFAVQLRAGSQLVVVGAQHELLMEQDRYRTQFWAAFHAFVPGTPLF